MWRPTARRPLAYYLGFTQPDNDDLAHRNRWIVEARFSASVDVVTLVGIPERFQEVAAIVGVDQD